MVEVIDKTTANIRFVDEATLSAWLILDTERVLTKSDLKDVPFVALARKQRAKLWTGDKALVRGLRASHPKLTITTFELWERMELLEH